jgi:hypothetical protein
MVHLVQTVHLYFTDTNTVSKRTKTRFHMTHSFRTSIGCVQDDFRAYGTFFTNRALSCVKISTISKWTQTKLQLEPRHLGVSSGASNMISEPRVRSAQTVHIYCMDSNTVSKQIERRFHMTHSLGVPSGAYNMTSEPMVHSTQIAHLSCIKITTISK